MKTEKGKGKCTKVIVAALTFAALAGTTSHAAFVGLTRSTNTAVATLTTPGVASMAVLLKNISNNATVGSIAWTGVTLPTGWKLADQYIQVDSTLTLAGSAIQIYTDNMGPGASPAFAGNPAVTDPSGLVDTSTPTNKLNMGWSIRDTVSTTTVAAVDPNGGTFQWQFFKDKATVDIPSQNITAFLNGEDYVTPLRASTAQFFTSSFFPAASPNIVYMEADFTSAQSPKTYQTSTLRLEAYTQ